MGCSADNDAVLDFLEVDRSVVSHKMIGTWYAYRSPIKKLEINADGSVKCYNDNQSSSDGTLTESIFSISGLSYRILEEGTDENNNCPYMILSCITTSSEKQVIFLNKEKDINDFIMFHDTSFDADLIPPTNKYWSILRVKILTGEKRYDSFIFDGQGLYDRTESTEPDIIPKINSTSCSWFTKGDYLCLEYDKSNKYYKIYNYKTDKVHYNIEIDGTKYFLSDIK